MIDKFTIGIFLFSFVLSISMVIYEADRIKVLEERIAVLTVQISEAEKNSRIARQDSEYILKLITKGEQRMTKEELKTREKLKLMNIAKEWLRTEHSEGNVQSLVNLILSFAEPREKQKEIDAEQIRALQKQNRELTDRVKELQEEIKQKEKIINTQHKMLQISEDNEKQLEAQIEKMKNWCNCKNYQQCLIELAEQGKGMKPSECCVNCKKWEIKEK